MRAPYKHTADEALWALYRESDENAFAELFQRYYGMLAHYGMKFTADQQLAEDVVQELMIRLWSKRSVVNPTESVKYYLLKSFRHLLFRRLRQTKIFCEKTDEMDNLMDQVSAEDFLIQNESDLLLRQKVANLMQHLTPRQQEILYLRFYQNLSTPEIAVLLDINAQSVSNIIQRAFTKLRTKATTLLLDIGITAVLWVLSFNWPD
ncbi:sigma-70 family RNA polymerase sigma factor [Ravibacter arvi]|uniref:RNA polymerase sigma factor n=1 Tax=Ravibacter arvi TaxID=2051041 RepID=UPI0031EF38C6